MIRKMFAAVLVLAMCFAMCTTAFAGGEISSTKVMEKAYSVDLNRKSGVLVYRAEDSYTYTLIR